MTPRSALSVALFAVLVPPMAALGMLTDEQKCEITYLKATAKRLQCTLKAREKAIKKGLLPDFTKCEQKLHSTVSKIEMKLGAACPPRPWMGATARFVDNGDGTLTDGASSLTWELKLGDGSFRDVDNTYPWSGSCSGSGDPCQPSADAQALCPTDKEGLPVTGCAVCPGVEVCEVTDGQAGSDTIFSYVDTLNDSAFAGHSDWRVPTQGDLLTILAEPSLCTIGPPCIADPFHQGPTSFTASAIYWTSGTEKKIPEVGLFVNFFNGVTGSTLKFLSLRIRAVRGGL